MLCPVAASPSGQAHTYSNFVNKYGFETVTQGVFTVLSQSLRFSQDSEFWWIYTGRILADMLALFGYETHVQYLHMLFFNVRVSPYLGPRPIAGTAPTFKSYMTDDHTPIEVSWVIGPNDTATVRYAIEPNIEPSGRSKHKPAALQMIDDLKSVLGGLDLKAFNILNDSVVCNEGGEVGAKHASQYFLGFDCAHSGDITLKAYFLPEVRSITTGVSKETIVTEALISLDAGFTIAWEAALDHFNTLPASVRPSLEIVAIDCVKLKDSRVKVYVRTKSTKFCDLEGLLTLGGKLKGQVIMDAMEALQDLWEAVMGMDISVPGWKERRLNPRISADTNDNHITGGLLLYYELKPGEPHPFPKVYLPVRHYCSNDLMVARGMEKYHRRMGGILGSRYIQNVESTFGRHRLLRSRTGIHTYVSLAVKKTGIEVTSYFNPEIYAPERVWMTTGLSTVTVAGMISRHGL